MDEMDSNLTEGQEMDILYHELMKTIPKDYLDMESVCHTKSFNPCKHMYIVILNFSPLAMYNKVTIQS